jgi:hypothetical protein
MKAVVAESAVSALDNGRILALVLRVEQAGKQTKDAPSFVRFGRARLDIVSLDKSIQIEFAFTLLACLPTGAIGCGTAPLPDGPSEIFQ